MEFDDETTIEDEIDINNNLSCKSIIGHELGPGGEFAVYEDNGEGEEDKWPDRGIEDSLQGAKISENGNKSSQSSRGIILYENPCQYVNRYQCDNNNRQNSKPIENNLDNNENFLPIEDNEHDEGATTELATGQMRASEASRMQNFLLVGKKEKEEVSPSQEPRKQEPNDGCNSDKSSLSLATDKKSERIRHLVRSFESFDSPPSSAANPSAPQQPKSPSSPAANNYHHEQTSAQAACKSVVANPRTPTRSIRLRWPPSLELSPDDDVRDSAAPDHLQQQQQQQQITAKSSNGSSSNGNININNDNYLQTNGTLVLQKPTTIVKPMPPKTPPKSNRVKCFNIQLTLNKPATIGQLFQDEQFLRGHFFDKLQPLDRCSAAQVCRLWRNILYSNQFYWKNLVGVIDCTQLRREHLVECILSTWQSAKLRQQASQKPLTGAMPNGSTNYNSQLRSNAINYPLSINQTGNNNANTDATLAHADSWADQDEIWRIQELCNRYARSSSSIYFSPRSLISSYNYSNQQQHHDANGGSVASANDSQQQQATSCLANSKSSSIPSQISSTLSSISISSLLSPLSESSRIDSIRERLYTALDERGFDAICLFGATNDDIEELVCKTQPNGAQQRVRVGRLQNCPITDKGLDLFVTTFNQIEELELTGCNAITNALELKPLENLSRLIITDCINIADGLAQQLVEVFDQLDELIIQAYHMTDAFLEYTSLNNDTSRLRRLELPNCKELTNSSMLTIAKSFQNVETLSISGSNKITDDGIEILTEHGKNLRSLDLSWCNKITDVSLECIACDLSANLRELILDRNIHITDIGLGYLATMSQLSLLYIRWCSRVTDLGLESILTMRTLKHLSLAGLHQITARSLLCLVDTSGLEEVELTNCPAVSSDLMQFLRTKMPNCNIIF